MVLVTPVTSAPKCFAICTADDPTPPDAPTTRTLSPALMPALVSNGSAVVPPNESDAASSNDRFAGLSDDQAVFGHRAILGVAAELAAGEGDHGVARP